MKTGKVISRGAALGRKGRIRATYGAVSRVRVVRHPDPYARPLDRPRKAVA